MTIDEQIDHALDKADAVYKASNMGLSDKVHELEEVLGALILVVKRMARDLG